MHSSGLLRCVYLYAGGMFGLGVLVRLLCRRGNAGDEERADVTGGWDKVDWTAAILVVITLTMILTKALMTPLRDNDPLEYATMARLLNVPGAIDNYPMAYADPNSGYYWPATHPLGFVNLLRIGFLLQGQDADFSGNWVISPFFWIMTVIGCGLLRTRSDGSKGFDPVAALLMASVPGVAALVVQQHVDPVTAYGMLVVAVAARNARDGSELHGALLIGLAMGLVLTIHSLCLFVMAAFALWLARDLKSGRLMRGIRVLVSGGILALLLGGQFVKNNLSSGAVVGNQVILESEEAVDYAGLTAKVRGLDTLSGRLIRGVGRPFWNILMFGVLPWLLLFALWRSKREQLFIEYEALAILTVFVGIYFAGAFLNVIAPIQNHRYQLVLSPLVVGTVARWLSSLRR